MKTNCYHWGILLFAHAFASAAPVTLLDEEFTNGTDPTDTASAVWTTTDANGFEAFGNGGFAARGISGGATPADPQGGLEILNVDTATTITITVTLPADLDPNKAGTFTFLAGQRIESSSGGLEGDLEIVNITDERTLRAKSAVDHPNFTMALNTVSLDFVPEDAGDTLELRFYESAGNSARGLILADLELVVDEVVPGVPTISDFAVSAVTETGATLDAQLNVVPSDVTLFFGESDFGEVLTDWQTNGTAEVLGAQDVGAISVDLTGLSEDTEYTARFYAVNTGIEPNEEAWSAPSVFATGFGTKVVDDVQAEPFSAYEIDVLWTDVFNTETGYLVERSPAGANTWEVVASLPADTNFYTDAFTGVAPSTSYDYRVSATGASGNSGVSNVASATSLEGSPLETHLLVNFDGTLDGGVYTLGAGEVDTTGTFQASGSPVITAGVAAINTGSGGGLDGFEIDPSGISLDLSLRSWVAEIVITPNGIAGTLPTALSVQGNVDFRVNNAKDALEALYWNGSENTRVTTDLPTLGERVHLALVWQPSTATATAYIDGVSIGTVAGGSYELSDPGSISFGFFGRTSFEGRGVDGEVDAVAFQSGVTADFDPTTDFLILPQGQTFNSWIAEFGVDPSLQGFNQDADGDGLVNGVEGFFGTDPSVAGSGITGVGLSGTEVSFTHPLAETPLDDLTGAYLWSTDLVTWYVADGADGPGDGLNLNLAAGTPSAGSVDVTGSLSQPVDQLFIQISVTSP